MDAIYQKGEILNTDEQLVTAYKNTGELAVLGQLYAPYMPLAYGVCIKYLKSEEDSKDAVMHIFEELIIKLKTHEVKSFKNWLYVLSRNHCLMQLRKDKKQDWVNIDDQFMELEVLPHLESKNNEGYLKALEKCLDALSVEQRTSVSLFYLEQRCYAEVAERTGYEVKKVKSYIQNGKRNLKICIEQQSE